MKNVVFLCLLVLILCSSSCKKESAAACNDNATAASLKDYTGLDGCRWVILLKDSTVLEPTNLSDFKVELKDGKTVCIQFEYTAGKTIKLLSIE